MADPQALLVATAAAQAVEFVGLPEAQLNLAQAAIHLATSPKSNRVTQAIFEAKAAAREAGTGECRRTCVMRITRGRRRSVTAPTTGIPMTTRRVTLSSSICPTRWSVGCSTTPRFTGARDDFGSGGLAIATLGTPATETCD